MLHTYVSSRHSQKFKLCELQWEKNLNCHSDVETQFFSVFRSIFSGILNCHISKSVRAFHLIPRLTAMPKYQVSSGTKCPNKSPIYLNGPNILSSSTIFGYAQPLLATVNHSQCGYSPNTIKRKNGSKKWLFWATAENINGTSLLKIT